MPDKREILDRVVRVALALTDLPEADRLDILMVAWLLTAANARNERIPFPNGFPEERDRQLAQLADMRDLVEAAEPDLEIERIFIEETSPEAIGEHLLKHFRKLREDDDV
jgi:hypothetical protein